MIALHSRIFSIIACLAAGAFALDYTASDRYNRADYTCTVTAVGAVSNLPTMAGTHKPLLTSAQMTGFARYNGILCQVLNVYTGTTLRATGYLFSGSGDVDPWNRVVVMGDGFDYGNKRRIDSIATSPTYNKLVEPRVAIGKGYSPLANGYDVMFVDFADGTGDMRINAKAYLRILEEVCSRSSGFVTAGGFSMGGVVSRLALLYGQKTTAGVAHASIAKVKKYLAVDSPMQGAGGMPISLQELVRDNAGGEPWNTLNSYAAQQMLFVHATGNGSGEHDKFYGFVNSLGNYPKGMQMYSFSNANWAAPYSAASYNYTINVRADLAAYAMVPNPNILFPFPPLVRAKVWSTTVTKPYKTVTFSGRDLEAGSANDIIADVETNAKPMFNAYTMAGNLIAWGVINPLVLGLTAGTANVENASISSSYTAGFKPTFMPVSSVFDLSAATPAGLKNTASLQTLVAQGYTPFNGLYLISSRYQHITFTEAFCANIVDALGKYVPRGDFLPAVDLLLQ